MYKALSDSPHELNEMINDKPHTPLHIHIQETITPSTITHSRPGNES